MGVLGWSPSEFWEATLYDLLAALDGYAEKNGTRKDTPATPPPPPATVARGLKALLLGRPKKD